MNLPEFRSNSREVLSTLNEDSESVQQSATLLGVVWDLQEDTMVVNTKKCDNWPATKRQFLAYTTEFYDFLGLFTPATLSLPQHLWKKEYDWNQPFDNTDRQTAAALLERFQEQSLKSDRKLTAELDKKCAEIHVFVDACRSAYFAVAYLCSYSQDRYENSLLMSKSRMTPIRGITIPRLELMAALIGSRSLNFVKGQLKHTGPTFLWSDSQATLHWIATATTVDRFVDNRLAEIRRSPTQFRYVDSGNNPADLATLTGEKNLHFSSKKAGIGLNGQLHKTHTLNKLERTTVHVLRVIKRVLRSTQIHLGRRLWETVELEGPVTAEKY
uniref:Uncharacterized protein n=1 Tax=Parascaris equorum TaxID=6256 RepID=A0A914S9Z5_PAREQ